jgi:hypothetical protein
MKLNTAQALAQNYEIQAFSSPKQSSESIDMVAALLVKSASKSKAVKRFGRPPGPTKRRQLHLDDNFSPIAKKLRSTKD